MRSAKGFFILENIIVFSLGSLLMLAGLQTYHECFLTLQKKLLLEDAIVLAEAAMHNIPVESNFDVISTETTHDDFNIKEVQICHNDKIIFSLAKAK